MIQPEPNEANAYVVLDVNELRKDGTVAVPKFDPSPDGRLIAYAIAEGGSDWNTLRVLDVDSGENLPEVITRTRYTQVGWLSDSRAFFYVRYPERSGSDMQFNQIWLHTVGTPTTADRLIFEYPDRPALFSGEGGRAMARFVESWSMTTLHPAVMRIALVDIHDMLGPEDRAYFRQSREQRLGRPLEEVVAARADEVAAFAGKLEPLRAMLKVQPFIGGPGPLFADYIVFGALQWLRVASPAKVLQDDDPVAAWFERCLDLHEGLGRGVRAA